MELGAERMMTCLSWCAFAPEGVSMFQVVVQSVLRRLKSVQQQLPPPPVGDQGPRKPERAGLILVLVLVFSILTVVLFTR